MESDLSLYIHWPFCLSKCPYCDFNSHAGWAVDDARWGDAVIRELDYFVNETSGRTAASVFFGGGTPSLMAPRTVAALIQAVGDRWPMAADAEITLEANPNAVEAKCFAAFREAGVNRLSVGVQSLDDAALAFLGRTHDAAEARAAVALAAASFQRFSIDLIYARPGQTAAAWTAELAEAVALAGDHLSLYQLTVEPGTGFHRSGFAAADEDTAAALYEVTGDALAAAGLPAYEVSNYARPGAECRHNLAIWRGGDYVGVGPGAHGRVSAGGRTHAVRQTRDPGGWLAAVEARGHAVAERRALSARERRDELVMMGLRLGTGVEPTRFRRLAGETLEDSLGADRIGPLVEGGFVAFDATGLRTTPAGRLRLDAVLAALLA